jgi:PhoH-like ATPase
MSNQKVIIPDTCVLVSQPEFVDASFRAGYEVCIPYPVLSELGCLKKDSKKGARARIALKNAWASIDRGQAKLLNQSAIDEMRRQGKLFDAFSQKGDRSWIFGQGDNCILQCIMDAKNNGYKDRRVTFLTKDHDCHKKASLLGLEAQLLDGEDEEFQVECQTITGLLGPDEDPRPNTFRMISEENIFFYDRDLEERPANLSRTVWNVIPKDVYQSMAIELMLDPKIRVVSLQSEAGLGKTLLALACALTLTTQMKRFRRIVFLKITCSAVGKDEGFLPGQIHEKTGGHFQYLTELAKELSAARANTRLLDENDPGNFWFDSRALVVELGHYLRGATKKNVVYIIDEAQNLTQKEILTIASRMGENCKLICLGDVRQIDRPGVNEANNGLNHIVKKMISEPEFAHFVLQGERSRGPIADMARRCGL